MGKHEQQILTASASLSAADFLVPADGRMGCVDHRNSALRARSPFTSGDPGGKEGAVAAAAATSAR